MVVRVRVRQEKLDEVIIVEILAQENKKMTKNGSKLDDTRHIF